VTRSVVAGAGAPPRIDTRPFLEWRTPIGPQADLSPHDPSDARHPRCTLAGATAPRCHATDQRNRPGPHLHRGSRRVGHWTFRVLALTWSLVPAGPPALRIAPADPVYDVGCRRKTRARLACSIRSMRLVPTLSARSRFPIHSPPGASLTTTCMIAHIPRLAAISSAK